jgi:hypothetical protein
MFQTVIILTLIVVFCVSITSLIDWSVTAASQWQHDGNTQRTDDIEPTDFSDLSLSYGIVIDCGSSGSRVFVYCWPPHTGEPGRLLNIRLMLDSNSNPVIMKIEPGKVFEVIMNCIQHSLNQLFSCILIPGTLHLLLF